MQKRGGAHSKEDRLEMLQASLSETSQLIQKLQEDADLYNQLNGLTPPQVAAVQRLLRSELDSQGRRAFWLNALLNLIFFIAGVLITLFITFYWGK